jgi:hypothetical protein
MANLLPADKAAEQLFRAVEHYKGVVLVVGTVLRDGKKKKLPRELMAQLESAYSKVSAAQWELEQVLKD